MNRDFIASFYEKHVDMSQAKEQGDELRCPCPSHKDKNPSFSVNLLTGTYKCFAANCLLSQGGSIYTFKSIVDEIPYAEAKRIIDHDHDLTNPKKVVKSNAGRVVKDFPFKQLYLDNCMADLLANPTQMKFLHERCLWTEDTIKKFNIGWNGSRFIVPITVAGKLVNLRMYAPHEHNKWISVTGFGDARVFPLEHTEFKEIFLVEGEKDCILLNQMGFNAVTVTGGAGSFISEWKRYFARKDVIVCYDIDPAGRDGAEKVSKSIATVASSVKNVLLPLTTPTNADLTDYFLAGNTPQDFRALVDATLYMDPVDRASVKIEDAVYTATLSQINEEGLFYKRCKTKVRIVGKDSAPFIVPSRILVTCNRDNGKACNNCGVGNSNCASEITLDETTPHILEMIECSAADKKRIVRDLCDMPTCRKFEYKELGHQPVIRVSVIPSLDEMDYEGNVTLDAKYVERDMYFIGQDLNNNVDYEIEAIAVPSAKDQSLVHLGYKVKHADSSIENFKMTPEIKKRLSVFQCPISQPKLTQSTLT